MTTLSLAEEMSDVRKTKAPQAEASEKMQQALLDLD